jgi:type IV pilus assembly protein PilV
MASSKRAEGGFSLLEVLISIVVLSIGLLGAVGMLLAAVRSTNESGSFTTAVNLVRELSEKARINKNIAARNNAKNVYVVDDWKSGSALPGNGSDPACIGGAAACKDTDLAAWDVHTWLERVDAALPDARVAVCFDDNPFADDGNYAWPCSKTGRNLVVKLGWTPRMPTEDEKDAANRPPRVVMQLIPGQDYDDFTPKSF